MTAHRPMWLRRLSHPRQEAEPDDLASALAVEGWLRELREAREPLDLDVEAEAALHVLLGRGSDR